MPRGLRSWPLDTVQNVDIETARIHRKTKRGEISTPDGYRMVQMLAVLKTCLESSLLELLAEMKRDEHRKDVPRSHEQASRCARCGFRKVCDQSLV